MLPDVVYAGEQKGRRAIFPEPYQVDTSNCTLNPDIYIVSYQTRQEVKKGCYGGKRIHPNTDYSGCSKGNKDICLIVWLEGDDRALAHEKAHCYCGGKHAGRFIGKFEHR